MFQKVWPMGLVQWVCLIVESFSCVCSKAGMKAGLSIFVGSSSSIGSSTVCIDRGVARWNFKGYVILS